MPTFISESVTLQATNADDGCVKFNIYHTSASAANLITTVSSSDFVAGISLTGSDKYDDYIVECLDSSNVGRGTSIARFCSGSVVPPDFPCNVDKRYDGEKGMPIMFNIPLGRATGEVRLDYNAYSQPDKFVVSWDDEVVINTGYVGRTNWQGQLDTALDNEGYDREDIRDVQSLYGSSYAGQGHAIFNKTKENPQNAILRVYAPLDGTLWNAKLSCPSTVTESIAYVRLTSAGDDCDDSNSAQVNSLYISENYSGFVENSNGKLVIDNDNLSNDDLNDQTLYNHNSDNTGFSAKTLLSTSNTVTTTSPTNTYLVSQQSLKNPSGRKILATVNPVGSVSFSQCAIPASVDTCLSGDVRAVGACALGQNGLYEEKSFTLSEGFQVTVTPGGTFYSGYGSFSGLTSHPYPSDVANNFIRGGQQNAYLLKNNNTVVEHFVMVHDQGSGPGTSRFYPSSYTLTEPGDYKLRVYYLGCDNGEGVMTLNVGQCAERPNYISSTSNTVGSVANSGAISTSFKVVWNSTGYSAQQDAQNLVKFLSGRSSVSTSVYNVSTSIRTSGIKVFDSSDNEKGNINFSPPSTVKYFVDGIQTVVVVTGTSGTGDYVATFTPSSTHKFRQK